MLNRTVTLEDLLARSPSLLSILLSFSDVAVAQSKEDRQSELDNRQLPEPTEVSFVSVWQACP